MQQTKGSFRVESLEREYVGLTGRERDEKKSRSRYIISDLCYLRRIFALYTTYRGPVVFEIEIEEGDCLAKDQNVVECS